MGVAGFNNHGSGVKVEIEGLDAIVKGFDDMANLDHYKPLVKKYTNATATTTHRLMGMKYTGHKKWSNHKHGYIIESPTGTTKRSTLPHITDDGMTGYVQAQESHFEKAAEKYQGNYKRDKKARAELKKKRVNNLNQVDKVWGRVVPGTSYFPYLEYGTRYMRARPTLTPAFELRSRQFARAIDERLETWSHHKNF